MTDRQWKSLGRYVRNVGNMLGLRDWTFLIDHQPETGEALASITPTYGRKLASIQFCANWPNLEPETQRHAVVHELIHVHLAGARGYVYHALPSLLGEAAWSAFESAYRQQDELAVDGIADSIAAGFPLWEGA